MSTACLIHWIASTLMCTTQGSKNPSLLYSWLKKDQWYNCLLQISNRQVWKIKQVTSTLRVFVVWTGFLARFHFKNGLKTLSNVKYVSIDIEYNNTRHIKYSIMKSFIFSSSIILSSLLQLANVCFWYFHHFS